MFEAWKARRATARQARAEREAAQRAERQRRDADAKRAAITTELDQARLRLDAATGFHGATGADVPDGAGVILKKGESVYCVVTDAVLIEPRKGPGQWKGRSQGVSVPIPGTSLRYRVGASKGQFVAGEEKPTAIDTGTFVVTTTRGVFTGQKQSREWQWTKLLSATHFDPGWTAMAVANRQKVSGVGVDSANRETLDFWIDLAIARAIGTEDAIVADCRADVEQLEAALAALDPPALAPPPAALPPPSSPTTN